MGSNCFCSWKCFSCFRSIGETWVMITNTTSLIIKLIRCKTLMLVPSNVQSARQEALLYVFEDNEAVIKMIIKGRSPTMRHVSRTHRVALDWLFDRINLDPKIQIKYIDTKNQLEDILTKGNFTRDEWNHLLNLFNISHFSSTACTAAMAKRAQQESGEERVTAKSIKTYDEFNSEDAFGRVLFNFIKPGEDLVWKSRSWEICCGRRSIGKPEKPSQPGYSQEDYGQSWSSQEWKGGAVEHGRSGKPGKTSWDKLQKVAPHREELLLAEVRIPQGTERCFTMDRGNLRQWITKKRQIPKISSSAVTQQNLWTKSKTKCGTRQKRMSNVAESGEEHSVIWGNVHGCDVKCGDIHGKEFLNYSNGSQELWRSLTLKQMFDVTAQLVNDEEEIHGLDKIQWEKYSWTRLSLMVMKQSSISNAQ